MEPAVSVKTHRISISFTGSLHFVFTAKLKSGIPLPATPEVSLVNPVLKVNQVSVTSHWTVYTPIGRHIDGLMAKKKLLLLLS